MDESMSNSNPSDSIPPHTPVDVVEGHNLPSPALSGHADSPGGPSSVKKETAACEPSRAEGISPVVIPVALPVVLPDGDANHPKGVSGPAGPSEEVYADGPIPRSPEYYSHVFTAPKGTRGGPVPPPIPIPPGGFQADGGK